MGITGHFRAGQEENIPFLPFTLYRFFSHFKGSNNQLRLTDVLSLPLKLAEHLSGGLTCTRNEGGGFSSPRRGPRLRSSVRA